MEIEISEETYKDVENASKELGINEKEVIAKALKLYLLNLKAQLMLKEELEIWESASIEDLANFNKEHNL